MADARPTTCVVADDHPAVLRTVSDVLAEAGIDVVARAADGLEALAKIETCRPDVALLDLQLPKLSGIDVVRRLDSSEASTAVLLYSGYAEVAHLTEALDAGARGVVLKGAPLADLVRAVETVVADAGFYVDPILAGALAGQRALGTSPALTQREREVLRLLADGLSNEEIGKRLFLSPETVRTHVRKAMGRLGSATRTQAVATALRKSLIT